MNIYTAKERRALTLLLLIIGCLLFTYYSLPYFITPEVQDYSAFTSQLANRSDTGGTVEPVMTKSISKTPIDINMVSNEELMQRGVPASVAKAWINYRKAIGGFKDLEQLEKIYGLKEDWLQSNKDQLILKPKVTNEVKNKALAEPLTAIKTITEFDPNLASNEELTLGGVDPVVIAAIEKYRKKGGTFYTKEEMKYLPGVTEDEYNKISDKIKIDTSILPELNQFENKSGEVFAKRIPRNRLEDLKVDVNNSNEYEWQQLSGIGPYYAKSIVRFRNHLGGFSTIEQVAETYNLPDSVFTKIKSHLTFSPVYKRIDINTISADSLRLHPYINWKQASIIINYRKNHGPYSTASDFYKLRVFDSAFVHRIEPYLEF